MNHIYFMCRYIARKPPDVHNFFAGYSYKTIKSEKKFGDLAPQNYTQIEQHQNHWLRTVSRQNFTVHKPSTWAPLLS